jgi:protein transport protein SEC24
LFLKFFVLALPQIRRSRASFLRLRIIKRSDPLESVFFNLLLEDRSVAGMSYVEFLCHVHRQIQNKFA